MCNLLILIYSKTLDKNKNKKVEKTYLRKFKLIYYKVYFRMTMIIVWYTYLNTKDIILSYVFFCWTKQKLYDNTIIKDHEFF